MEKYIDSGIVFLYFLIILVAGIVLSKKQKNANDDEPLQSGKHLSWWETGLTMIAMMVDPGIMGLAGLSFIFGLYCVQWTAINLWFTSIVASLVFVGIYWRSGITTTPEYLEKRFNALTRGFFSLVMIVVLAAMLPYAVYMGALLLTQLLGWNFWINVIIISVISGLYVVMGGTKTMLTIDTFQGIFLLIVILFVGVVAYNACGGLQGIASMQDVGESGRPIKSFLPPLSTDLNTKIFFPLPAILTGALVVGLSWIVCNFGMAQRLLAAKTEKDAQKALIMTAGANVLINFTGFLVGVAMRMRNPDAVPDSTYMNFIMSDFPIGVRGLVVAGIMAALVSTVDGLISSTGVLATNDIYVRFINPKATPKQIKFQLKMYELTAIACIFIFIPLYMNTRSAQELLQSFWSYLLGVVVAIFLLGILFTNVTAMAANIAMIVGLAISMGMAAFTSINFAYISAISFVASICTGLIISAFDKNKKTMKELSQLTVWTLADAKGPWIGFASWPALRILVIAIPASWLCITLLWEWLVM
ncbi:MAG: sodium/solute symporter [Cytophagales bacterium]|nr:sodium/solute symporter [Cytophagales bacterium]